MGVPQPISPRTASRLINRELINLTGENIKHLTEKYRLLKYKKIKLNSKELQMNKKGDKNIHEKGKSRQ